MAGAAAAAVEMLCIVEVAARRWLAGCSEQERGWVPRRELKSWVCLMHEVELPLAFGPAHADMTLSEGGAVATKNANGDFWIAASTAGMRSGRHFAQLMVAVPGNQLYGVIRPGWDVEGGANAFTEDSHCFYNTGTGLRAACPASTTGRGCRTRRSRVTASACCSTSTRAA